MNNSEPRRDPKGIEFECLETVPHRLEDRVLDIGCGDGRLSEYFAREANRVVGTDIEIEHIREARSAYQLGHRSDLHFVTSRAEAIPFADQSFTVAIFSWSL